MGRGKVWECVLIGLCLGGTAGGAVAQEALEIHKIEYLQGVPGHPQKMRGSLRISPEKIVFVARGKPQFILEGRSVDYVAAQAQASIRARTADVGASAVAIAAAAFPPAYPLVFLFHKGEKHLLSIEYLEGEPQIRRLALFNIRDHSARAVKKMIDTRLGLIPDYYRDKDREEEARKRTREAETTPAGFWETSKNTMVGDSQYARVLLEKGTYAVLIFDRYLAFRPQGMEWAKYRIPLRKVKSIKPARETLTPLYKGAHLVGFDFAGKKYLFY